VRFDAESPIDYSSPQRLKASQFEMRLTVRMNAYPDTNRL
jgi:hypothetical protein